MRQPASEDEEDSGQLRGNRSASKRKRDDVHTKIDEVKRGKKDETDDDDEPPPSQSSMLLFLLSKNDAQLLPYHIEKQGKPKPEDLARRSPRHHPSSYPSTPLTPTQRYSSSQRESGGDVDNGFIDVDGFVDGEYYPDQWFDEELPAQLGMVIFSCYPRTTRFSFLLTTITGCTISECKLWWYHPHCSG